LIQYVSFFEHGHDFIDYIVGKGADVNSTAKDMKTAIFEASYLGHFKNVQVLLKHGANPKIRVPLMVSKKF